MKNVKNNRGWAVGRVHDDEYRKRVTHKNYFLGAVQGWIFDVTELENAERLGARCIHLYDEEKQDTYDVSLAQLYKVAIEKQGRYGIFYVVPLESFSQDFVNSPVEI